MFSSTGFDFIDRKLLTPSNKDRNKGNRHH